MDVLRLQYDVEADRLKARLEGHQEGETVRVERDKLTLWIDRAHKLVVSFEVDDFRHFVSYHLLGELFGDEVIRGIAAFQSSVLETSRRSRKIDLPTPPPSGRRAVEELLRAA